MTAPTIFKRIIDKKIPAKIAYEDDLCLAFHDVNPQAPLHLLVIPKKEIPSLTHITPADTAVLGHLIAMASTLPPQLGYTNGFRLVVNCGKEGGQTVDHLHVHVLAGRSLGWPPG